MDYKNYKTDLSTPLRELDSMYEEGALEFVSNINTEDVDVIINENN